MGEMVLSEPKPLPSISDWPEGTKWQSNTFTINFLNCRCWSLETSLLYGILLQKLKWTFFRIQSSLGFFNPMGWSKSVSALQFRGWFYTASEKPSLHLKKKKFSYQEKGRLKELTSFEGLNIIVHLNLHGSLLSWLLLSSYFRLKDELGE